MKRATGVDDGELGLALLGVGVGALPAMLLAGRIADRVGGRAVGAALAALGCVVVLPGLAGSLLPLAASLVVLGAASGALDVAMNAAVSAAETSGRRLMNLAHAIFSLTMLVASVVVGLARSAGADRRAVLGVVAACLLLLALASRGGSPPEPRRGPRRRLALSRTLLVLGALCALAFSIESGIEAWSAIHLEDTLGAGAAVGGLGPGLFAAAMVTGRLLAQVGGERFGDGRLLTAAGLVACAGMVTAAAAPGAAVALAGFALAGLGVSVAAPTLLGLAGRSAGPADRASTIASVTTLGYLGFLVSPPLVGLGSDLVGLRAALLLLAGCGLLLATAAARTVGRLDAGSSG